MTFLVILLSLCVYTLGNEEPTYRIFKGNDTEIEEHPYQVGIYLGSPDHQVCGGSILNENTIVTAAHCLRKSKSVKYWVGVGSTSGRETQKYEVADVVVHKQFGWCTLINNYDVAVLKLAKPLTFSNKVQPISLQPAHTPVPAGTKAFSSGWGILDTVDLNGPATEHLQGVEMFVLSDEDCKKIYSESKVPEEVTNGMLCAKNENRGALPGDSGGPLVANGKLIGIFNWADFHELDLPRVYANVSTFHDFIAKNL